MVTSLTDHFSLLNWHTLTSLLLGGGSGGGGSGGSSSALVASIRRVDIGGLGVLVVDRLGGGGGGSSAGSGDGGGASVASVGGGWGRGDNKFPAEIQGGGVRILCLHITVGRKRCFIGVNPVMCA